MTPFQILALTLLGLIIVGECVQVIRRRKLTGFVAVRLLVWLGAAAAIASPGAVQQVAGWLGIGRGADVVLYLFVLAFLAVAFYLYAGQVRLRRQLTEAIRRLAVLEARRGG
ncbi:MAG: DUF2304 domain-containing protein [Gemmatales bacterium]|nr:DUF2304 domain-containing protein [Gemmatales bacterium]MDW8387539.1 DUF2304 domain-containing protein [Gemmatales bacterium]